MRFLPEIVGPSIAATAALDHMGRDAIKEGRIAAPQIQLRYSGRWRGEKKAPGGRYGVSHLGPAARARDRRNAGRRGRQTGRRGEQALRRLAALYRARQGVFRRAESRRKPAARDLGADDRA